MKKLPGLAAILCSLTLAACATPPAKDTPEPKWDVATEAEVAAALDFEFQKAAKNFVQLKKDGVLMFCKRQKLIGSNLPSITCLTEAQLREQVQNMTKYRDDMRNRGGKCTHGPGCLSGAG